MQFYFKTLDIPNHEIMIEEFNSYFDYFKDRHITTTDYFHKIPLDHIQKNFTEFNHWAKEKNLFVRAAAFIILSPKDELEPSIHIDAPPASNALNFGLQTPEGAYTGLYELSGGKIIDSVQGNGIPRKLIVGGSFNEITRFDLTKPTLFNTQVPHGVYTPPGTTRLSISFRFFNDPLDLL
jgi:hypothetical protein